MVAVIGVGADLADDDRLVRGVDLAAQRRGDIQLATDLQAELDAIEHGACGPVRLGDAGNRSEAQAGGFADHLQDGRDGADALDGEQVVEDGSHHLQALSGEKKAGHFNMVDLFCRLRSAERSGLGRAGEQRLVTHQRVVQHPAEQRAQ